MPNDFDPHTEIARIYTLRDTMLACRERTPKIVSMIDEMLDDTTLDPIAKIKLFDLVLNRAYGKPRQTVHIDAGDGALRADDSKVKVYIPDNGRANTVGKTIDIEAA